MECFVAAIRTKTDTAPASLDVAALQAAVQHVAQPTDQVSIWTNTHVAFAGTRRRHASDVTYDLHNSEYLVAIDGPLTPSDRTAHTSGTPQHTDTRTSAFHAAAQRWIAGQGGFDRLSGSFCGIIHDAHTQHTLLCTDRLGSRALYVYETADTLYCASDMRVLLHLPHLVRELDLEAVAEFIRYQMILEHKTLYRAIRVVPPATILAIDHRDGTRTSKSYWQLRALPPFQSRAEAIDATAHAFATATNRIVADSSRLAVLLSGGFDSRMLLASLRPRVDQTVAAFTFGSGPSDDIPVAQQIAAICGIPWQFIEQSLETYWQAVPAGVATSAGFHSAGHMHLWHPTASIAAAGYDTVLNGWGFDLPYSGSYLPKEKMHVLGRELYTYRLDRLDTRADVLCYLHNSLDVHINDRHRSMCGDRLQPYWQEAPRSTLARLIDRASTSSDSPYDWLDFTLFGFGIAKFRSYAMLQGVRAQLRERNPLFEHEVIDVFQRLPYQWRFLGPVFRRAVQRLSPALAAVPYSNIGISAFAPPMLQGVALQTRTAWRANLQRAYKLGYRLGFVSQARAEQQHGGYLYAVNMARHMQAPGTTQHVYNLLQQGVLADQGIIDAQGLAATFARCHAGDSKAGFTIMTWAALALWLDAYPSHIPIGS